MEDIGMCVALVDRILDRAGGMELYSASTAEEGLLKMAQLQPDIVLVDLGLPGGMDGSLFARAARKQGYTGEIVAVTARVTTESRASWKGLEFDDFLAKPFGIGDLLSTMRRAWERLQGRVAQAAV